MLDELKRLAEKDAVTYGGKDNPIGKYAKITLAAIEDAQKWERICKAGGEDLYDFIRRNDDGTFDFAMLDDLPAAVRAVLDVTGGGE